MATNAPAPSSARPSSARPVSRAAVAGFLFGFLACILLVGNGPAYRWHVWGLSFALRIVIPGVVILGFFGLVFSLIGVFRSHSKIRGLIGVVLGLIAIGIPVQNIVLA